MSWPAFNALGDLPVGVYRATLADVIAHFGHGAVQRVAITTPLQRIYALAHRTGFLQRFIIFGSYVTTEPKPARRGYLSGDAGRFSTAGRTA